MTTVFVPRERRRGERRVAAVPETVEKLVAKGFTVVVEAGAGQGAHIADEEFEKAGARIVGDPAEGIGGCDLLLLTNPPSAEDPDALSLAGLREGSLLIGLLAPHGAAALAATLAAGKVTSIAMELLPRVTRAQPMDVLSSQASIAGYKAALIAACRLGRHFPLLMTAAGTIRPARVVILGGGVAGLQALATAKRLGAVVEVSDIRPAVKEQVESLGGRFIDLPDMDAGEGEGGYAKAVGEEFLRRQREILTRHLAAADVVITTAQVAGKPAPRLIGVDMVRQMRPGAVIVDLAAEQGGNCELTKVDEEVVENGVLILGPRNVAATVERDASALYARNLLAVVDYLETESELRIDPEDEVIGPALLTHDGTVRFAPARKLEEASA